MIKKRETTFNNSSFYYYYYISDIQALQYFYYTSSHHPTNKKINKIKNLFISLIFMIIVSCSSKQYTRKKKSTLKIVRGPLTMSKITLFMSYQSERASNTSNIIQILF